MDGRAGVVWQGEVMWGGSEQVLRLERDGKGRDELVPGRCCPRDTFAIQAAVTGHPGRKRKETATVKVKRKEEFPKLNQMVK